MQALSSDAHNLNRAISRRTQQEVFAIARKALADLATTSLEERMGEVFTRRLREMDGQAKEGFAKALKTSSEPALVRSAFDLPADQRAAIQNSLNETFSAEVRVKFETAPELVGGIELSANGQKMAWSIADYLASLENGVDELLKAAIHARSKALMNMEPESLEDVFESAFAGIGQAREAFTPQLKRTGSRHDRQHSTGIAKVSGLPGVGLMRY